MKNNTFTTLSVLLIGLLFVVLGFFGATMLNGSPMGSFFSSSKNDSNQTTSKEAIPFTLSQAQKDALISLGVDPARAPSSISGAQQNCLIANLGEQKFASFKNGAVPTVLDYMQVKKCL